jgi:hypothetical protein
MFWNMVVLNHEIKQALILWLSPICARIIFKLILYSNVSCVLIFICSLNLIIYGNFMIRYEPLRLDEIRAAQQRVSEELQPTPLVRFNGDDSSQEIYLKLENLQPIRAFKIRAAINAIKTTDREKLRSGVWTVSAGNWAQGLAWAARKLGVKCTCVVPDSVPKIKEDSIRRLGADIV